MNLSPKALRFFALAWAVIKGFFWPVLLATAIVAYGLWGPLQPSNEHKDAAKTFFATLFFIMFFFGQYKRVEKQTDDKDAFKAVNEQLLSLQELVRKIRPILVHTEGPQAPVTAIGDVGNLLSEARVLLNSGHQLAALLQGGVAFEHAVRRCARDYNEAQADKTPLHELIKRLALVPPKEVIGELHALRMIRNRLTHISEYELKDLPDADKILYGYEWATKVLASVRTQGEFAVAA